MTNPGTRQPASGMVKGLVALGAIGGAVLGANVGSSDAFFGGIIIGMGAGLAAFAIIRFMVTLLMRVVALLLTVILAAWWIYSLPSRIERVVRVGSALGQVLEVEDAGASEELPKAERDPGDLLHRADVQNSGPSFSHSVASGSLFRVVDPPDHFVSIRQQPTKESLEIARLKPGTQILCTQGTTGQFRQYGGRSSAEWYYCPEVGGYVFSLLLKQAQ